MNALPNELLEHICSFIERRDLWAVTQVSSRFRSVAMLPFLALFGVSQTNIESGALSLSGSFFLILVVARIRPIRRLTLYFAEFPKRRRSYDELTSILAIAAPIPDIMIYNRQYMLQRTRREAVYLLSRLPQTATNTLWIVKANSMCLSRPRSAPPIQWKLLPPPLGSSSLSTPMKMIVIIFGIPLLFAYLVSGIVNLGVLSVWAYRRLVGPAWSAEDRIVDDAGLLVFDDWMRIQMLQGQITLVTLTAQRSPVLTIKPMPGLPEAAYSPLLTSLDLGTYLAWLTVEKHANLDHPNLMHFLHRHLELTNLTFAPSSIQPSSLVIQPHNPKSDSKVVLLTAPASYIPALLPAAPNVQRICIPFTAVPARLRRRPTFDLPAYRLALAAIAALPGTHPLSLTLSFRLTASSLPWLALPPTSVSASSLDADPELPETRLLRVHDLTLCADGPVRFRPAIIHALARWLGLFPGLTRVTFGLFPGQQRVPLGLGAVEKISLAERAQLAEVICAACNGITRTQDVAFNIMDD
ncbi:hypothetical protein C8R43DRAFT_1006860 [Mycena crocata]|nr:hypothetical protein C8R43DRAFT_1006860 [Mycena crocata]